MAINYNAGTLEVTSGIDSGTATSGAVDALNDTGQAWTVDAYWKRIVWIYAGTGAGQTRAIASNTATKLVPYTDFDPAPDNTSQYRVSYNVTDLVSLQPTYSTYEAGGSASYPIVMLTASLKLLVNSFFGGLDNTLYFDTVSDQFDTVAGSLFQFGRLTDDATSRGMDGGLIGRKHDFASVYIEDAWLGGMRLYGTALTCKYDFEDGGNARWRINNLATSLDGLDLRDITVRRVVLMLHSSDIIDDCIYETPGTSLAMESAPASFNGNTFKNVNIAPRADAGIDGFSGGDIFDFKFSGSFPSGDVVSTPVFLFKFGVPKGVVYSWNANFGSNYTYATALKWWLTPNDGVVYEGVTVDFTVTDSSATAIEDATLGLIDTNGDEGWTTSKGAVGVNYAPVKSYAIQTNASGKYVGPFGSGEGAFVIPAKWTYLTGTTSTETAYYPFTFRARKYGKQFVELTKAWAERTKEGITLPDNDFITEATEATVAAYTGIAIDYALEKVTITEDHTIDELYDYLQYHNALTTSIQYDEILTTSDGINYNFATNWDLVVTGSGIELTSATQALTFSGTGALTIASGGFFEDSSQAVWEDGGSQYFAAHVNETFKEGATPVEDMKMGSYDSGGVNRLYSTALVNGVLLSDVNGLVEGYVVWKIDSTSYNAQTLRTRQYGYNTVEVQKTFNAAPVTEDILVTVNPFVTDTESNVAAYTGITLNYGTEQITITSTKTLEQLYDFIVYSDTLDANLDESDTVSTPDGSFLTLQIDWDLVVTGSGVVLQDATKTVAYQGTGALTVSSGGLFEDSISTIWEDGGSIYYGSHFYYNVKDTDTSANIEDAVVAHIDSGGVDRTYNTSLVNGGLLTDASGNAEGYAVWKIDATPHTSHALFVGEYDYVWSQIPKTIDGSQIGSSGTYETVRMTSDSFISLSKATADAVSGVTVDNGTVTCDMASNTLSDTFHNLKSRQASTSDIETGVNGYMNFYDLTTYSDTGLILRYDGSVYWGAYTWIFDNSGGGGTLKLRDAVGAVTTQVSIDLNSLVTGSRVQIYNTSGATESAWAGTTAYTTGDGVQATTPDGLYWYECVTAGTSGAGEPTWPTVEDDTVVDGTVTWKTRKIELYNAVIGGTTAGVSYEHKGVDRTIRFRAMFISGSTDARRWWTASGTVTVNGLTIDAQQEVNQVYIDNNVNGSTVTECSISGGTIKIYVDDPTDSTTAQRIYNWNQYYLATENGIREQDDYVESTDQTHYTFTGGMQLVNQDTVNPLEITGANIVPPSGSATAIYDVSNGASMILNFNRVEGFPYSTGSGLSGAEHDQLFAAALATELDIVKDDTNELQSNQSNWLTATGFSLASVCTEARLARLDATISSRLATSGYTAPDNAGIAAIQGKTDNLPDGIKKNTALLNFQFLMVSSTDNKTGQAGLTITAERAIDGGALAATANTAVEISDGIYGIDLDASDLNGDTVTLRFTAPGANERVITILTQV